YRDRTTHASCGGSFLFSEESTGTRKIAELCATLFDGARDRTLVFDGFGTSMHPLVVEKMVKDYLETSAETLGQFIITTYDTGILSPDIFRKDEIWFIDKKQGCSELYSLEEFESDARIDSHLQRAYLEGRFGAIPICTGPENHETDRLSLPAHLVPKNVKRSVAK
ncbi:MAG: ATP-binding protein, partial [archaeon]|nr:ATP-binding protein [archaeon]